MVASWSARVCLYAVRRNACASMVIQQWRKFPSKVVSCRDEMQLDMVAIHQHGLKSTTSAGAVRG